MLQSTRTCPRHNAMNHVNCKKILTSVSSWLIHHCVRTGFGLMICIFQCLLHILAKPDVLSLPKCQRWFHFRNKNFSYELLKYILSKPDVEFAEMSAMVPLQT